MLNMRTIYEGTYECHEKTHERVLIFNIHIRPLKNKLHIYFNTYLCQIHNIKAAISDSELQCFSEKNKANLSHLFYYILLRFIRLHLLKICYILY